MFKSGEYILKMKKKLINWYYRKRVERNNNRQFIKIKKLNDEIKKKSLNKKNILKNIL
jgi:GTP-sensing pleiotropic transcriptional regulator CodY